MRGAAAHDPSYAIEASMQRTTSSRTVSILAAVAIVATTACTGSADPAPAPVPTREVATTLTAISPSTGRAEVVGDRPVASAWDVQERSSVSVSAQVTRYLAETFGSGPAKAPWYDDVQSIAVRFNTAVVHTDLSSGPADREKAERICSAVSLFPYSADGGHLSRLLVEVYGQGDRLLANGRGGSLQPAPPADVFAAPTYPDPLYGTP
jgi:hypothetical protein